MHLRNWIFLILFCSVLPSHANQCKALLSNSSSVGSSAGESVATLPVWRGYYQVGIPTLDLVTRVSPEVLGRQRESNWCWAASIQMVMAHDGINLPQEEIVARTYGALINLTVQPEQLVPALSGWSVNRGGRQYYSVATQLYFPSAEYILNQLSQNQPLIAALNIPSGHAVVVTGLTYDLNSFTGQMIPRSVVFRDPWPDHESKQEMAWVEFQARFITLVGLSWVNSY